MLLSELNLFILSPSYRRSVTFHSNIIKYLQYINIGITWVANDGCEAYMSNICRSLFAAVYNFNWTGWVTHALACQLGSSGYAHLLAPLSLVPLLKLKHSPSAGKLSRVDKKLFVAMVQIFWDWRLENREHKNDFLRFLTPGAFTTGFSQSQQMKRISFCRNTLERFPMVLCKISVPK